VIGSSSLCSTPDFRPFLRSQSGLRSRFVLILFLASLPLHHALAQSSPSLKTDLVKTDSVKAEPASAISPADYQSRLQNLDQLIAACQQATTAEGCQSQQVGPDVKVALPSGPRSVHFAWLRTLLARAAGEKSLALKAAQEKAAKSQAAKPPASESASPASPQTESQDYIPPATAQRLTDARQRLVQDEQAVEQSVQQAVTAPARPTSSAANSQRAALAAILAAKEYNTAVKGPTLKQRILEKIGNWIDKFFGALVETGSRSKWIGITAEIVFVLLICIALVWFLIRLERQGRYGPTSLGPGAGAASARDWQLWLEDARQAATRAAWRDAIHLLYWASISRLESSGLWPADRARTPREYLALLASDNPHYPGLSALTRSFERTWYAARPAAESDFQQAERLAAQLGAQARTGHATRYAESPARPQ
jgi:hypothetical protein